MKIFHISEKQEYFNNKLNLLKDLKKNDLVVYKNKQTLIDCKCKIDNYDQKKWDRCKKFLNDYEYIYTSSNYKKNVCQILPISRSYFKIHEIIIDLELIDSSKSNKCVCIAEGPGGFIHSIHDYYKRKNIYKNLDSIYAITLISNDKSIPYWNNSVITNKKNKLFYGKDSTGDIYKKENVDGFIDYIRENHKECSLVTADGGFDYSNDYNSQELSSYKLLYSEIFIALNIQDIGGNFVIKVFDLFNYQTIQLLYILYCFYDNITFYKPTTSRLSNSEKYIVCKGFNDIDLKNDILEVLNKYFSKPEELFIEIPKYFLDEINKYNDIFVEKQIQTIESILNTINKYKENPTKDQLINAKRWCELYQLPINNNCIYL